MFDDVALDRGHALVQLRRYLQLLDELARGIGELHAQRMSRICDDFLQQPDDAGDKTVHDVLIEESWRVLRRLAEFLQDQRLVGGDQPFDAFERIVEHGLVLLAGRNKLEQFGGDGGEIDLLELGQHRAREEPRDVLVLDHRHHARNHRANTVCGAIAVRRLA